MRLVRERRTAAVVDGTAAVGEARVDMNGSGASVNTVIPESEENSGGGIRLYSKRMTCVVSVSVRVCQCVCVSVCVCVGDEMEIEMGRRWRWRWSMYISHLINHLIKCV